MSGDRTQLIELREIERQWLLAMPAWIGDGTGPVSGTLLVEKFDEAADALAAADREVGDQMASKLEAQMALMAITKALDLTLAEMGEGWTEGAKHILARIALIVDEGERGFAERDRLAAELAEARAAHMVQRDVADFHRALDIPIGDTPAIRRPELRASLIEEEAAETCAAIRAGDLIEALDGLCDLLCVTYGAAEEFGVNLAPFWDEVHRTNMAKRGGPVREDGKRLKPEGWTPPDLASVLAAVSGRKQE